MTPPVDGSSARLAWAPALPFAVYAAVVGVRGDLRWEHVGVAALALGAVCTSASGRRFFAASAPLFALFLLFDSMRYWRDLGVTAGRVLTCELRAAELRVFGLLHEGALVTPNDYFATHHHPALDLLCAVPYGTFLVALLGQWLWIYRRDAHVARRLAWVILLTHVAAFAMYHLVPAAPPWYVRAHGCTVDTSVGPNAAALLRVDALLGVATFERMYARGAAVFGALPSLHVAYPVLGLLAWWRRATRPGRALLLVYPLAMGFAAVYLDHHYLLDLLLGVAFAVAAHAVGAAWPGPRAGAAPGAPRIFRPR